MAVTKEFVVRNLSDSGEPVEEATMEVINLFANVMHNHSLVKVC